MGYGKPFILKAVLQWVIPIDLVLPELFKKQFSLERGNLKDQTLLMIARVPDTL